MDKKNSSLQCYLAWGLPLLPASEGACAQTINTMAVLTMLLTQDRCTKNYLLYLDLNTNKWQMLAYDLKSALNADAGLGG